MNRCKCCNSELIVVETTHTRIMGKSRSYIKFKRQRVNKKYCDRMCYALHRRYPKMFGKGYKERLIEEIRSPWFSTAVTKLHEKCGKIERGGR